MLGRPTANSIAINALSDTNAAAYFEYGTAKGVYTQQTVVTNLVASQPFEVVLSGLQPDTRYYYRLRLKYAGESSFEADAEHSFIRNGHRAPPSPSAFRAILTRTGWQDVRLPTL